jgi:hypothetical protein
MQPTDDLFFGGEVHFFTLIGADFKAGTGGRIAPQLSWLSAIADAGLHGAVHR